MEPWIAVHSGKKVDPFEFKPEDVNLLDIAHSLSQLCRFTGHTDRFYSVAQHCVLVSHVLEGKDGCGQHGLLHEVDEPYLNDISSPVKQHPEMQFLRPVADAIFTTSMGVLVPTIELSSNLHEVDACVCLTEG